MAGLLVDGREFKQVNWILYIHESIMQFWLISLFMKSIFTIDKYSIVAKETENGKGNDGKEKKQKN